MISGVRVVVVVPAWNEAPRIARVIRSMPASVDRIVVVDDASRDGTAEVAGSTGDPRVVLVRHGKNRGVGAAIATGYARAIELTSGARDAFVVMAGDGQMHPDDLEPLVRPIAAGEADYAKGCRFGSSDGRMPFARRVGGEVFSRLTSVAIGLRVRDAQCGYTAITRAACERLDLAGLWPRYGYPNDLLGQAGARKMRIVEVPVRPVYADEVSRLRLRHLPVIFGLIGRAWVRRRRAVKRRAR